MVISPLNYPGNKAKIVSQILEIIPNATNTFVDVFCGSGIVSLNSDAKKILCNDYSIHTIELLKYFEENSVENIIQDVENIISKYKLTYSRIMPKGSYVEYNHEGLSNYNRIGFNELKKDYNKKPDVGKLFVLIIYGFNHYLRFNKNDEFNIPVGKVDFSKSLYEKTVDFVNLVHIKNLEITQLDFRNDKLYNMGDKENCIYYFDPPYLITKAPYNKNWDKKDELDLLNLLDKLNCQNKKFALSNVLESNGKINELLAEWASKYNTHIMKRQYRNANYRRKNTSLTKEVLITNF